MRNYSTITTNHRICYRLAKFSRSLLTCEFSIDQEGDVLDNGKLVRGFSITFYNLEEEFYLQIREKALEIIKAKLDTEKRIYAIRNQR